MNVLRIAAASLMSAVALCASAYFAHGYWHDLAMMLANVAVSLGVGLLVVNRYLNTDERRRAAMPLLRLIAPAIQEFHNEHFIRRGRLAFGTPVFNELIASYQKHGRRPDALSPAQRDGLYELIKTGKAEFEPIITRLLDTLKEISSILGWSFSPSLMRNILDCRYNIVALQNLKYDDTIEDKLRACEHLLDFEADSAAVLRDLTSLLGMKEQDYTRD
jgi:hypothetical protein